MSDDGFLRRWSRRKAEARKGAPPEDQPASPEPEAAQAAPAAPDQPARRVPSERQGEDAPVDLASLPDIDSLGPASDFKVFLRKGVPVELRRKALRRMWQVKPAVSAPDLFVDYAEDYTDAACAVPGIRTLYQVGRGYLEQVTKAGEPAGKVDEAAVAAGEEEAGEAPVEGEQGPERTET